MRLVIVEVIDMQSVRRFGEPVDLKPAPVAAMWAIADMIEQDSAMLVYRAVWPGETMTLDPEGNVSITRDSALLSPFEVELACSAQPRVMRFAQPHCYSGNRVCAAFDVAWTPVPLCERTRAEFALAFW